MRVGQIYREKMKKAVLSEVALNDSTFVATYHGITSAQMNDIRKNLKRKQALVYVTKSSVARLALKEANFSELANNMEGQMAFIFSNTDVSELSKELVRVVKENEGFKVSGGYVNGELISLSDINRLSSLPSKEALLSQFLATIQTPISRLAGALNAKSRELLSILKQLSEKKGGE